MRCGSSRATASNRPSNASTGATPKGRDAGSRTVEFQKLLRRFLDICNAIAYAHSRGVLHRDLKPGNIMVGQYGETLVVDWGLAKVVGAPEGAPEAMLRPPSASGISATLLGSAIGTSQFMSPEQAAGRPDRLGPASDVSSRQWPCARISPPLAPISPFSASSRLLRRATSPNNPIEPSDSYYIARLLARCLVLAEALRPVAGASPVLDELIATYAGWVMVALRASLKYGRNDLERIAAEPDLHELRGRRDFQELVFDRMMAAAPFASAVFWCCAIGSARGPRAPGGLPAEPAATPATPAWSPRNQGWLGVEPERAMPPGVLAPAVHHQKRNTKTGALGAK